MGNRFQIFRPYSTGWPITNVNRTISGDIVWNWLGGKQKGKGIRYKEGGVAIFQIITEE
jgi:hypothetical protein